MKQIDSKDKKEKVAKLAAQKYLPPSLVSRWVAEVFEPNPTKKDYQDALTFVEDIIKNTQQEPKYLKLLTNLALQIEKSKFTAKLIPYMFKTISSVHSLKFDHQLIMAELEEAAKELRQLKEKA